MIEAIVGEDCNVFGNEFHTEKAECSGEFLWQFVHGRGSLTESPRKLIVCVDGVDVQKLTAVRR